MSEQYECDQCGACCQGALIVEATWLDLKREPKIQDADPAFRDKTLREVQELLADEMRVIVMACGADRPCAMLDENQRCKIYPTRPNVCVAMEAGDEQCQGARKDFGIEPLEPTKTVVVMLRRLAVGFSLSMGRSPKHCLENRNIRESKNYTSCKTYLYRISDRRADSIRSCFRRFLIEPYD